MRYSLILILKSGLRKKTKYRLEEKRISETIRIISNNGYMFESNKKKIWISPNLIRRIVCKKVKT